MHERMESLADLYAAGNLSPDERREADVHAAGCGACATILREAADFRGWVTGTLAPDAPPADLEERVIARLRASSVLKTKRWRFVPGRLFLKFAGGLAAAGMLVFVGHAFDVSGRPILEGIGAVSADFRSNDRTINDFSGPVVMDSQILGVDGRRATHSYGYNGAPATGEWAHLGWNSKQIYERDLSQVKEYNLALEKDNAELRPKAEGGVFFYRSWKSANDATGIPQNTEGRETARMRPKGLAALDDEHVEKYPSTVNSGTTPLKDSKGKGDTLVQLKYEQETDDPAGFGKAAPKTAENLAKLGAVDPDKAASQPKNPDGLVQTVANPGPPQPPIVQDTRRIIRTADVDLEVDSYDATSTKLTDLVQAEKGFIASANVQKLPNGKVRAVVTVRVPPGSFEAVIAKLKDFGTVRNQNVGSQDVSKAYVDLETRRDAKQAFLDRLKKLMAEAKGTAKELLEIEIQMGKTIEEIESIKGELKFYDSQIGLSTLTLTIAEKDLGLPFEYVQTLQSNIGLTARDADDAYAKAQKEIADAGGQVVDSKMNRQNDGSAVGTIRARVDAAKFPALREALKRLGHVTNDTVNQQKTARGGHEGAPKADAPLKKEQAVVDVSISTPPVVFTRSAGILVESAEVQKVYAEARATVEAAGAKIVNGSLTGQSAGTRATIVAELDADKFDALVKSLKSTGKLKDSGVRHELPAPTPDGAAPLLRERARIEYTLFSPPQLIGEEHGIGKTIEETLAGSWKAVLWSVEKLFVGLSLAGPWIGLALVGWLVWRRVRRRKPA